MPIKEISKDFNAEQATVIEWLQHEIAGLRSNRVKPDLITSLQVEAYGSRNPLQNIASVSSGDARTLVISPYDKNTIQAIEKAVTEANLGVQPNVDGQIIRLIFPSMTDEVRHQTIKLLHKKAEEARVRLRQARDEGLKTLKKEKESSDITEDDFYDGKEELDKLTHAANEEIASIAAKKEEDLHII